jgi:hypothetical protein
VSDLKPFELASALLIDTLVFVTLIGLVARRHLSVCRVFGLYLLAVFASDLLMLLDATVLKSEFFYSRVFWLNKEILLNALKFGVALELAYRVFASFPGARATAQFLLLLLLGTTLMSVASASGWSAVAPESLAGSLQPRIVTGTTWMFALIAALVLWYRLPIKSMPKAILIGFVPFLLFSYLALELVSQQLAQAGLAGQPGQLGYLVLGLLGRSFLAAVSGDNPRGEAARPHRPGAGGLGGPDAGAGGQHSLERPLHGGARLAELRRAALLPRHEERAEDQPRLGPPALAQGRASLPQPGNARA